MLNPLYKERIQNNDTHASLVKKLGISRVTISNIEHGKVSFLRSDTLHKLSHYISYDIEEFIEKYITWREEHRNNKRR